MSSRDSEAVGEDCQSFGGSTDLHNVFTGQAGCSTALTIDRSRYWLKVVGVDAQSDEAQMINLQTVWYGADERLIGESVGDGAASELPVASGSHRAVPNPAFGVMPPVFAGPQMWPEYAPRLNTAPVSFAKPLSWRDGRSTSALAFHTRSLQVDG